MTPELRSGLYAIDPNELGYELEVLSRYEVNLHHRIKILILQTESVADDELSNPMTTKASPTPSSLSAPSMEVDEIMLGQLVAMGFSEAGSRRALHATQSKDQQIAVDYIFDHDNDPGFHDPPPPPPPPPPSSTVPDEKDTGGGKKRRRKPRLIPLELQKLFTQLQHLNAATISTGGLTKKGFMWQDGEGNVQHDAHELNRYLDMCTI